MNKTTNGKMKQISEYEAGKINYEETLSSQLVQANNYFQENRVINFCYTVQSIWNNCFEEDRKEILETIEKINNGDGKHKMYINATCLSKKDFIDIVEKDLFYKISQNWLDVTKSYGSRTRKRWRRAYQIIQEVLRKKYQGKMRVYEKDAISG